jgi:hypothetical protein
MLIIAPWKLLHMGRRKQNSEDDIPQYASKEQRDSVIEGEEKKTVIEAPPREEPEQGKEGGEPERLLILDKKGCLR